MDEDRKNNPSPDEETERQTADKPETVKDEQSQKTENITKSEKKRGRVAFYLVMLFASAFVIVLISFVAQFKSEGELADVRQQLSEQMTYAQGVYQNIEKLQQEIVEMEEKLAEKEARIAELEDKVYTYNDTIYEHGIKYEELRETLEKEREEHAEAAALNAAFTAFEELTIAYGDGNEQLCAEIYERLSIMPAFEQLPETVRQRAAEYGEG